MSTVVMAAHLVFGNVVILAQPSSPSPTEPNQFQSRLASPLESSPALEGEALRVFLRDQFVELDNLSYRARARARWNLEQYPEEAIEQIRSLAPSASVNAALQQIELLDYFATRPDVFISTSAFDALRVLASKEGTSLASMAKRCMMAIEDAKEEQASEILRAAGASIGNLPIPVNGSQSLAFGPEPALEITSRTFIGKPETYQWIRFLRSVRVVAIEGPIVSDELVEAIAEMPKASKILFKQCEVTPDQLRLLRGLTQIEHLELSYVPAGDEIVAAICELPLSESLRLFGTKVTAAGEKQIAEQLDGIEIYRGAGGFLGIQSQQVGPVIVTRVVPGSAAEKGGINEEDRIIEINAVAINNFPDLREELAKYEAQQTIDVKVMRPTFNPRTGQQTFEQRELKVVLGILN